MIDWDRVTELRDEIGAEDLATVIEMFLEEVAEKLQEVMDGTSKAALSEDMHFLRSSALNIGFVKLAEMCAAVEEKAGVGHLNADIAAISACYEASAKELREHEGIRVA